MSELTGNAFEQGRSVERESRAIIEPFLEEHSDGRVVYTDRGRLAMEFQKQYGDVLIQDKKTGALWTIELKAEKRKSDNLFLEVWSNGSRLNTGWMFTSRADLLFYHFLESDELYIVKLPLLQRWFHFGEGIKEGRPHQYQPGYERFPLKAQAKYNQMNDTWGKCVPISVIQREVRMKKVNPLALAFVDAP